MCSPERDLSSFCEFPTHPTTAATTLEPSTPYPSFPKQNPPRFARRVLPRPRPGRRRVRPSRASPARLRSAPARLRRACTIPRPPRFARAVLLPFPPDGGTGHVPRQALRGQRCPPLHAVPRPQASRRRCAPSRALLWPRTTFRCVSGEPTRFPSSRLRRSPHPVLCAASAAGTEAAKRSRQGQRHQRGRQLLRQRLRLVTRATVVNNANAPSPHYPPAVSCSLRTSLVMPTLITKSSTEHATASGKGVASPPQRFAPVVPPRHCTCCCKFVPCPLPRAAHGTCSEAKFRASAPCGTPRCGVFICLSPAAGNGGPGKAAAHVTKHVVFRFAHVGASAASAAQRLPWCRAKRDFHLLQHAPHKLFFSSRTHGPTGFAATCHAVARSATAETPRPAGPSILVTPWA